MTKQKDEDEGVPVKKSQLKWDASAFKQEKSKQSTHQQTGGEKNTSGFWVKYTEHKRKGYPSTLIRSERHADNTIITDSFIHQGYIHSTQQSARDRPIRLRESHTLEKEALVKQSANKAAKC